jgi:hypothetical protein
MAKLLGIEIRINEATQPGFRKLHGKPLLGKLLKEANVFEVTAQRHPLGDMSLD